MFRSLFRLITQTSFLTVYALNLLVLGAVGAVWVFTDQETWNLLRQPGGAIPGSDYLGLALVILPILAVLSFVLQGALKSIQVRATTGDVINLAPSAVEDCVATEIREANTPVRGVWIRASQKGGGFSGNGKLHLRVELTVRLSQPVAQTTREVHEVILRTLEELYNIGEQEVVARIVVTDVLAIRNRSRSAAGTKPNGNGKKTRRAAETEAAEDDLLEEGVKP
ncbi:MAG: hypothetical protein SFY68_00550 [Candidatus Sumerlaeia bacterium]|nr:hypothetical protein [Candidatus Sumerlaeia bacterium]